VIQPGIYRARGVDAAMGEQNGKQYFAVMFRLEDGSELKERWYMVNDQNTEISLQNMLTSGWNGQSMLDLGSFGSCEVDLVVEHRTTPGGKVVPTIRYVNALGQGARGAGNVLSFAEQKAVAAKWNHVLVKLRAKVKASNPVPF
jgi:hypothetical protein